jgi:REP element-mobilizing transposase RayT/DNA-binding transcriptional regulator YiaG
VVKKKESSKVPRRPREKSQTDLYHIMMRGNNKNKIFQKDIYKRLYLNKMQAEISKNNIEIYAWCIMTNHIHIVLKGEKESISKSFQIINSYFAAKYNYFEKQIGHVFQDRFKSEIIENKHYLLNVIRYVHRNPVKANLSKDCTSYHWSSYNIYINHPANNTENSIQIIGTFFSHVQEFKEFHNIEDYVEHLETEEDLEKYRIERAVKMINDYCSVYNLFHINEINQRKEIRNTIIRDLSNNCKLSQRRLSQLTGVSKSTIQEIAKT